MKREQIIEILERFITESDDYPDCILKYNFSRVADEILALHLDVPSDEEIIRQAHKDYPYYDIGWNDITVKRQLWLECAKWVREEIIKRNK